MKEQIALRFPEGTKTRIQALAHPGETMTRTLLRAIDLLEKKPTPHEHPELDMLKDRMTQIEQTLAKLSVKKSRNHQSRDAIEKRILDMSQTGLSTQQIADHLNQEGIPTFSGRGQWQRGTISNLIRVHR